MIKKIIRSVPSCSRKFCFENSTRLTHLQVRPDLYLEQNRLSKSFFSNSRFIIGLFWLRTYKIKMILWYWHTIYFDWPRIVEKWVWKSVWFQEIRTDLYFVPTGFYFPPKVQIPISWVVKLLVNDSDLRL